MFKDFKFVIIQIIILFNFVICEEKTFPGLVTIIYFYSFCNCLNATQIY